MKYMYMQKCPSYQTMNKKIGILAENRIKSKLKHRKANKSILCGRFGVPYKRPGD